MAAHPLFSGFVAAGIRRRDEIAKSARTEEKPAGSTSTVN
jgi:hypothetical protein